MPRSLVFRLRVTAIEGTVPSLDGSILQVPGYDTKTQIFGFVATQKMQIELHKEVKVAPKHNKPKPDDDLKGFE